MPHTPTPSPRRRRKDARPAEFLDAALESFVEKGYAATRLEDVARRAGAAKGTVYLYFQSKENLFEAVIREGLLPVMEEGESLLSQFDGKSADLLRELLQGWWLRVGETRLAAISKIMIAEAGNFPEVARFYYEHVISRGRNLMRRALERGIAEGEFRPINVESAIDVLFAPLLMLALWRHSFSNCSEAQQNSQVYLATHFDLLLHGLAKTPEDA